MITYHLHMTIGPTSPSPRILLSTLITYSFVIFSVGLALYLLFLTKPAERGIKVKSFRQPDAVDLYAASKLGDYFTDDGWNVGEVKGILTQPDINGAAGMIVELNDGSILFQKDLDSRRPLASLIKIVTAVVALEHMQPDQEIIVSEYAATVGENSMGISEGEVYTLEELLYGLVLHSGNDAAYAIAEGVAGDVKTFVEWMNIKGKELGLKNSYFTDPSGLNDASYTSPRDLVYLTRYALKNPKFKQVAATLEKELPATSKHKYLSLYNQTNLLSSYPGVAGVKTGYTEEAGLCLVTYAKNNGVEVVGVVLGSNDRKGDMILMLDYAYSVEGVTIEHHLLDPVN